MAALCSGVARASSAPAGFGEDLDGEPWPEQAVADYLTGGARRFVPPAPRTRSEAAPASAAASFALPSAPASPLRRERRAAHVRPARQPPDTAPRSARRR